MKAFLSIETRIFPILKKVTSLGRDLDNTLVFADNAVSRFHAQITNDGEDYYLEDLKSTGGTQLNGERVTEKKLLNSGDKISLAGIDLFFYSDIDEIDQAISTRTGNLDEPEI